MPQRRKQLVLVLSGVAATLLAGVCALYLWSAPADSMPRHEECSREAHGPFLIVDCGVSRDAPLLVYSRYPVRLLGDCGYWAKPGSMLCSIVFWLRNR